VIGSQGGPLVILEWVTGRRFANATFVDVDLHPLGQCSVVKFDNVLVVRGGDVPRSMAHV